MNKLKIYLLTAIVLFTTTISNGQALSAPGIDSPAQNATISFPLNIKGMSFTKIVNSVWYPNYSYVYVEASTTYKDAQGIDRVQEKKSLKARVDVNGNWSIDNLSLQLPPSGATNLKFKMNFWQQLKDQQSQKLLLVCDIKTLYIKKLPEIKVIKDKKIYKEPAPVIKKTNLL